MRPRLIFVLTPILIWFLVANHTSAETPLCTLSPDFEQRILSSDAIVGAAVYDLQSETIWTGGHSGPFAMHSAIKAPIAWAILSDAYDNQRELTKLQRDALFYMVAWSQNPDVDTLLSMIGGLSGMSEYYQRWGVPELIDLTHRSRWGVSLAEPVHLARLFAALAMSDQVPDDARSDGFDLLRAVVDNHRWGAMIPEQVLPGWESLIKTGNFILPEPEEEALNVKITPREDENQAELLAQSREAEAPTEEDDGQTPLISQARGNLMIVRMNSAAIWLAAPWQGSQARYVVVIMQESFLTWKSSREFQNQLGEILATAIIRRESGEWSQPSDHCLKRALS
jgi:hypothetical protein